MRSARSAALVLGLACSLTLAPSAPLALAQGPPRVAPSEPILRAPLELSPAPASPGLAAWSPLTVIDRQAGTYVFDPVERRVYVIGGYQDLFLTPDFRSLVGDYSNSVAALDLDDSLVWYPVPVRGTWTGPIGSATAVIDPDRRRLLLFGGHRDTVEDVAACLTRSNLFELSLAGPRVARELTPSPGAPWPPGRYNHCAMWDPLRHRMLVFGGVGPRSDPWSCYGPALRDLWELVGTDPPTWHPLVPVGEVPWTGQQGQLIYDARRDRALFVVGGNVWTLALGPEYRFTQVRAKGRAPYTYSLAALDPVMDRLLVQNFEFTYALSLEGEPAWTVVSSTGPRPPDDAFACLDEATRRFFLFGTQGASGGCRTDPPGWVLGLGSSDTSWHSLVLGAPPLSAGQSLVYDEVTDRLLLVALQSAGHRFGELWQLDPAHARGWTLMQAAGGRPVARVGQSVVLDSKRHRLILFAGYTGTLPATDPITWTLPLDGVSEWRPLMAPGAGVPDRSWGCAIYDPERDRLLFLSGIAFEGGVATRYANDLWELSLASPRGWRLLQPSGDGPPPGAERSAVYDPIRDCMVVVGGLTVRGGAKGDTWALELSDSLRWRSLTGQSTEVLGTPGVICDPVRDRLVALLTLPGVPGVTWELPLGSSDAGWRRIGDDWNASAPLGRGPFGATYDPIRDAMLIAGGGPPFSGDCPRSDTWVLTWGTPVRDIAVDFKPGDPSNTVNPWSHGVTEVALFGSKYADMATVDRGTVRVGAAGVLCGPRGRARAILVDLDRDGWRDLVVTVATDEIGLTDTSTVVLVSAKAAGNATLRGADRVRVVGRRRGWGDDLAGTPAAAGAPALAISSVGGAGVGGELRVRFVLPAIGEGRLDLYDVSGRRLASRDVSEFAAGEHEAPLATKGALRPGVYFVALRHRGASRVAKVAVVR